MPEVWKIDVTAELPRLAMHRARLTPDEVGRAARFYSDADRARFVVGRSTRRMLLARRLGIDPAALVFYEDPYGKPRILEDLGAGEYFNSSHSGRWVLHAFADVEVGVDVEEVRPEMARLEDFSWVLSAEERAFVLRAAGPLRAAALATVWVRKEAYVKALGEGLSRSLPDIGITEGGEDGPALAYDRTPGGRGRRWSFTDIEIDASHKACVVHAGQRRKIVVCDYRSAWSRAAA